jgi:hypothetical protein
MVPLYARGRRPDPGVPVGVRSGAREVSAASAKIDESAEHHQEHHRT